MNRFKRTVAEIQENNSRIFRIKLKGVHMAEGASILALHNSRILRDGTYVATADVLRLLKGAGVSYDEMELKQ